MRVHLCAERASGVGERGNGGTYKMREKGLRTRRSWEIEEGKLGRSCAREFKTPGPKCEKTKR